MISFITMSDALHCHNIVRSKDEMLEALSLLYEQSVKNGCTHFDLVIYTDAKRGE